LPGPVRQTAAAAASVVVGVTDEPVAAEPYLLGMAGHSVVLVEVTYCGPFELADRYLRRLGAARPMLDTVKPRSYLAVKQEGTRC
jgi:hypothetical protein